MPPKVTRLKPIEKDSDTTQCMQEEELVAFMMDLKAVEHKQNLQSQRVGLKALRMKSRMVTIRAQETDKNVTPFTQKSSDDGGHS